MLSLTKTDIYMLNHLIDRALFRIFDCGSTEDIAYIRTAVYVACVGVTVQKHFARFLESYCHTFSWAAVVLTNDFMLLFFCYYYYYF